MSVQISSDGNPPHPRDKATRQLCVGVYLDREFQDNVIKKVLLDPEHRVAPSYGFDLLPVVQHAKRALIVDLSVLVCFTSIVVGAWIGSPSIAITTCCVLGFWASVKRIIRTAPEVSRSKAQEMLDHLLRRVRLRREKREREEATRELQLAFGSCLVSAVTPVIVTAAQGRALGSELYSAAWLVLVMAVVAFSGAAAQRWGANRVFLSKSVRVEGLTRREKRIDEQQKSEYVLYRRPSGSPEPDEEHLSWRMDPEEDFDFFMGAGELVHRWLPPLSVPLMEKASEEETDAARVDLQKAIEQPLRECDVCPFELDDLIEALRVSMEEVGGWLDLSSLPGLRVGDRIYAEEMVLSSGRDRLRRPLDPEERRKILNHPYGPFHHYLEISTTPTGEVVTTVFLRVTVKAKTLNFDFAACSLTRLPREYEVPGFFGEKGVGSIARAGLAGVWNLPREVAGIRRLSDLPRFLFGWLWTRFDWTVRHRRGSSVGTVFSVRQDRADAWREAEHDRVEILGQIKIVEQRLLRAAENFLEKHDLDTSEFKKRAQTIISANVLNMGGRMDIRNSAIGNNSQVNQKETDDRSEGEES